MMQTEKIRKIAWARMRFNFVLTLLYETVHLTPLKRLIQRKTVKVITEHKQIGNITITEYFKDNSSHKKLIIAQHGYGSNKERMTDISIKLANSGYFVIAPDAYGHGERNEKGKLSLNKITQQAIREYDYLIEYYRENTDIDADHFSIVGQSMGGMIAYQYVLYGKYKPQVIAPTCTTPDMRDLMNYQLGLSYYENHAINHVTDSKEIEKYNHSLESDNPYDKIKNIEDVAVIVQNMRFDFLINSDGSDKLYSEWKDKKNNKSYQYHKILAFYHYMPDKAKKNIIAFLKLHD